MKADWTFFPQEPPAILQCVRLQKGFEGLFWKSCITSGVQDWGLGGEG